MRNIILSCLLSVSYASESAHSSFDTNQFVKFIKKNMIIAPIVELNCAFVPSHTSALPPWYRSIFVTDNFTKLNMKLKHADNTIYH